jgi:glycerol-3-phosphate dehydrogenase (NAD(P)+)
VTVSGRQTRARADTVGIVGAGAFGTALASVLGRADRRVLLCSRHDSVVEAIRATRSCPRLPSAPLPETIEPTTDAAQLAAEARFIVLAVGSTDVRERARSLGAFLDGSHIVVHAVGAFAQPGDVRVSEAIAQGVPSLKLGVLAGPALPIDLAEGRYASMVAASAFDEVVAEARRLLNLPPGLRIYGSRDVVGVELASALAGAYTIGLGLCDGLGMPDGPRAVMVTRAVAEGSRLSSAAGAEARTFAGLAGLGNMLVRSSERSADYLLGRQLAGGRRAQLEHTEGARAALAGTALAERLHVRMPLLAGIAAVLSGRAEPRDAVQLVADSVAEVE